MASHHHMIAIGVFKDRLHALKALEELKAAYFSEDALGYICREEEKQTLQETVEETRIEATTTGAIGGGVLGGVLGAAVALLIPGVGPAIAGGVLGAVLGGAALGAATGGFFGALRGMGITEEEIYYYKHELEQGRTIVTVQAQERCTEAQNILRHNGAYDMETQPADNIQQPESDSAR